MFFADTKNNPAGKRHDQTLKTTSSGINFNPVLWSPESPKLYKLVTTVEVDGKVVDRQETEFGIRTVGFDKDKGFLLNGKPYVLKGTCNHQDMAGVGAALPDALQYFRIAKLKELGQRLPHRAQSAHAGTARSLRSSGHAGHG